LRGRIGPLLIFILEKNTKTGGESEAQGRREDWNQRSSLLQKNGLRLMISIEEANVKAMRGNVRRNH